MATESDPGEEPDNSPNPDKPARPMRGAFPTPKSEIEKATPYIPAAGEEEDRGDKEYPEGRPDRPAETGSKEEDDPA